jgi:anthranilate/para-aminobenzoate synthase component I
VSNEVLGEQQKARSNNLVRRSLSLVQIQHTSEGKCASFLFDRVFGSVGIEESLNLGDTMFYVKTKSPHIQSSASPAGDQQEKNARFVQLAGIGDPARGNGHSDCQGDGQGDGQFDTISLARVSGTWVIEQSCSDPISEMMRVINEFAESSLHEQGANETVTRSGWLIMLAYELGHAIEPKSCVSKRSKTENGMGYPLVVLQRWQMHEGDQANDVCKQQGYEVGPVTSSMGESLYKEKINATLDYIAAGDVYQVNVAHHLSGSFNGNTRSCFRELVNKSKPKYGSSMIFDYQGERFALMSVSPELYFQYDPDSRVIRTQPMKGTRPLGSDVAELYDSVKDRAELDMITDLMRNDLGRICNLGSVQVVEPRLIESHDSGVLQASSKIEGKLREGMGLKQILEGTFPPGSVTGAPKVRAMQIIDELENTSRDSYCGAMVVLDDDGSMQASVSIRTSLIRGGIDPDCCESVVDGVFVYPVGAGIVSDSDPASEWAETLTKAAVLGSAIGIQIQV